ncbi:RES domain-containing protein, partial [Photobacterium damselae]
LARKVKNQAYQAIENPSLRAEDAQCRAIFTPKTITDVVQSYLVEMIWNGEQIAEVNTVENLGV